MANRTNTIPGYEPVAQHLREQEHTDALAHLAGIEPFTRLVPPEPSAPERRPRARAVVLTPARGTDRDARS